MSWNAFWPAEKQNRIWTWHRRCWTINLNKSMIADMERSFKKIRSLLSNSSDETRVNYILEKKTKKDREEGRLNVVTDLISHKEYQPSGEGGTRSPPTMPHLLQCRTTCNPAPPAMPHCMQCCIACKIQNGRQGAQKWQRGSGKVSTARFLGVLSNFR